MLNIQIISDKETIESHSYNITYSSFDSPVTFDLFDINIINLQDEDLWKNNKGNVNEINCSNDLESLHRLIESNQTSKIIILFPLNYFFQYELSCKGNYYNGYYLKDRINNLKIIINTLLPQIMHYEFIYENSFTKCGNSLFPSAFCFSFVNDNALTKAAGSNKATTMQITGNCIITTLSLSEDDCELNDFLDMIGLIDKKPDYPQWLIDLEKFDDKIQKETIKTKEVQIVELQKCIKEAQDKLKKNLRYKSILTENSDNLVGVVFNILEDVFSYNLSGFKDEKKEDFLIKLKSCTFIGEIKGITSNVKSENISQLDVHYQSYLEELAEKNIKENVKALLIINSQRNKPINERDEVHENQIVLAKRNNSLIIPTIALLTIYEKFLDKQITGERIIEVFTNQIGLINLKGIE